ncbi:MAG: helix-hairpin-helix domain-containing protein [Candidatus Omnitrophica bacterium]|nr:helix-hairpin-helix domain-containing protein [Candidatus Omnitrophota bacterium]
MSKRLFCPLSNRASVLVLCLWAIMILSILGMGLSSFVFGQIKFAKTYKHIVMSLPVARAAVKSVFYIKQDDDTPLYDTYDELTRENTLNVCQGIFCLYYFADKIVSDEGVKVIDESALININTASADVLARLPGMDEELADGIIKSGLRPFVSINEILMVEGMQKESFLQFKDMITVYGRGKINLNTVSSQVLEALGLDEEVARAVIDYRNAHQIIPPEDDKKDEGEEGRPEPEPEYGLSDLSGLLEGVKEMAFLSTRQQQDLLALFSVFDVKSEYLRFNIIPVFGTDKGLRYSVLIHPDSGRVISWKEG